MKLDIFESLKLVNVFEPLLSEETVAEVFEPISVDENMDDIF